MAEEACLTLAALALFSQCKPNHGCVRWIRLPFYLRWIRSDWTRLSIVPQVAQIDAEVAQPVYATKPATSRPHALPRRADASAPFDSTDEWGASSAAPSEC